MPGDEVLVAFESGNPRRPYVVEPCGTGGSGAREHPERIIRTKYGVTIVLDNVDRKRGGRGRERQRGAARAERAHCRRGEGEGGAPTVEIDASMAVAGVVQCDTLITNSVVASSYTPGVGNVM
jgi:uncharacterized protein involved in type VI secretion and phage assembly